MLVVPLWAWVGPLFLLCQKYKRGGRKAALPVCGNLQILFFKVPRSHFFCFGFFIGHLTLPSKRMFYPILDSRILDRFCHPYFIVHSPYGCSMDGYSIELPSVKQSIQEGIQVFWKSFPYSGLAETQAGHCWIQARTSCLCRYCSGTFRQSNEISLCDYSIRYILFIQVFSEACQGDSLQ